MRKTKMALAVAGALALAACGGGGHSPTTPAGSTTIFSTVLLDQQFAATILDAKLVVDGVVVAESASTVAASVTILAGQGSLSSGHHTLSVVIAAQTVSPSAYTALAPDISIFDASGTRIKDIKLTDRSATLATGQSIDYAFDS